MPRPEPSPGAVRAADAILKHRPGSWKRDDLAAIIHEETGAAAAVEALRDARKALSSVRRWEKGTRESVCRDIDAALKALGADA